MVKVEELMKKGVITADPNITMDDAARIMTNNRIGSIIIMEGDRPVGIVTTEDIVFVVAKGLNPKKVKAKDLPKKTLITALPSDSILDVARKMVKTGVKRIPVVRAGRLEGIISDKEILLAAPELINILSERLKAKVSFVASPKQTIEGICENCEAYSDNLKNIGGRWLCEDCR
jgi:CBS domain-containing protein